jgi:uncharacterized phage protein (TIGR02218 family)
MTDPWLIGPVTSSAYGWRLERRDGVTIGFTSHDCDVVIDDLLYATRPGMQPSSIVTSTGLDTDGLDISGSIMSNAIRTDDLRSGRWDSARLTVFLFDWSDPDAGQRTLATGHLGEVSYHQNGFSTELKGLAAALDRSVVPATSPTCRAVFCGAGCGLNAQRFMHETIVIDCDGDEVLLSAVPAGGSFQFGSLRWLDGAACGQRQSILSQNGATLFLNQPVRETILSGARVQLIEGCDKTITTCAQRFNNAINFRGEPYLPGNDALTRYPGAS